MNDDFVFRMEQDRGQYRNARHAIIGSIGNGNGSVERGRGNGSFRSRYGVQSRELSYGVETGEWYEQHARPSVRVRTRIGFGAVSGFLTLVMKRSERKLRTVVKCRRPHMDALIGRCFGNAIVLVGEFLRSYGRLNERLRFFLVDRIRRIFPSLSRLSGCGSNEFPIRESASPERRPPLLRKELILQHPFLWIRKNFLENSGTE